MWAFLFYAAATGVLCRAVLVDLASVLPSDPGDPVLNTWIVWWNAHAVPLTERWWNVAAFYPSTGVFAFSEHLLGIAPISTPIIWMTGEPVVAYNVAFLLSFPLSGLAAYLLALELTGRRDAAWLAGLVYAFAPYRIAQLAHLQVLSCYWAPLALLGLHRYQRDARTHWLALFAGAYLMQGLTNGYFFLFLSVLIGLWVIWFASVTEWRRLLRIAVAWGLAAGCLVPVMLAYRRIHDRYGFERSMEEIIGYGADLMAFARPSPLLDLWGWLPTPPNAEVALFPGLVAPLVVVVGLGCSCWRVDRPEPRWRVRTRWVLEALAGLLILGALVGTLMGPWSIEILGVRLSVDAIEKPVSEALLLVLILGFTSPLVLAARRRRSPFAFYVIGLFLMWFFSLGPFPATGGERVLSHAPYAWLMALPGFGSLRVPARFWMFAILCLSAAAALAVSRVVSPTSRTRYAVIGAIGLGVFLDGWASHLPTARVPLRSLALERMATGPVIELPIGNRDADLAAMFRSMYHQRPVANGHSGYQAPHYPALVEMLNAFEPVALDRVGALGVRDVRIDRLNDVEHGWEHWVESHAGVRIVAEGGSEAVFRLPDTAPGDVWPSPDEYGPPIPIHAFHATVNEHDLPETQDGDLWSRWHTDVQRPGDEIRIELDRVQPIGAVTLSLGPYAFDFPREICFEVSNDGTQWTEIWAGRTAIRTYDAALRDPERIAVAFPLDGRPGRWIRIRQIGTSDTYYWSIAELAVLGPR